MNKPKLNKNIWLKSQVDSLNVLADELNQCRQKLAIARNVHVNANLELIYNGEVKKIETELEKMSHRFYEEYLATINGWEKIKDE